MLPALFLQASNPEAMLVLVPDSDLKVRVRFTAVLGAFCHGDCTCSIPHEVESFGQDEQQHP